MVTIDAELRDKITRRSRRAWRYREKGKKKHFPRISDVTDNRLLYRPPTPSNYYGREKVEVVLKDDLTIVVDPPTTGLIDILTKDDIKRIKKHAGEIKAYIVVRDDSAIATVRTVAAAIR